MQVTINLPGRLSIGMSRKCSPLEQVHAAHKVMALGEDTGKDINLNVYMI